MGEDFSWQPAAGNRSPFWGLFAVVIGLSALAGFALGNRFPLPSLVEAIERNGVPTQSSAALSNPSLIEFQVPAPQPPVPLPIAPVVLNPGAAESPPEPPNAALSERAKEPARERAAPRDRKVIVVVRRVGPPYDTKMLRGSIQGGRLVVDERDRRGIIIR